MCEFNSDDHYIYYCGQEPLRRNEAAVIVKKSLKCSTWMQPQNDRVISARFQGRPFNIIVIQVYVPTSNAEEAEVERFYEDLQNLLELTPKKDVLFITGPGMQREEVKKHMEYQANLALEYRMKQGKG